MSALTGKPLKPQQIFTPMQHVRSSCCSARKVSRDDFTIIGHEKDPFLVKLKESIIIATSKPQLNGRETSVPLYLFSP